MVLLWISYLEANSPPYTQPRLLYPASSKREGLGNKRSRPIGDFCPLLTDSKRYPLQILWITEDQLGIFDPSLRLPKICDLECSKSLDWSVKFNLSSRHNSVYLYYSLPVITCKTCLIINMSET